MRIDGQVDPAGGLAAVREQHIGNRMKHLAAIVADGTQFASLVEETSQLTHSHLHYLEAPFQT